MTDPTLPPPDWATRLADAMKADPEWFARVDAAVAAVREARRVAKDARADEQSAAQRKVTADQAVEEHTATLRDVLVEKGTTDGGVR